MTPDELLIQRTFDLAHLGAGTVSPNPRVGCVIVKDGEVIGEGWHRNYGEVHAEVHAIYNAALNGVKLEGCFVYTTLSPCIDCARALIQVGTQAVFYEQASAYADAIYLLGSVAIPAYPVALDE